MILGQDYSDLLSILSHHALLFCQLSTQTCVHQAGSGDRTASGGAIFSHVTDAV
jgi:hypothetical protein